VVPVAKRAALYLLRTVYDSDGVAAEMQETIAAADKHRYEVATR